MVFETLGSKRCVLFESNCESAITESTEAGHFPKMTASPRLVTFGHLEKTSRVPVRVCKMSAKIVTLPPKSNKWELQEV